MTAPDYTELRERLDYTHAHGIFDAQIAGMLASPAEASTAIAELQAQVEALSKALERCGKIVERNLYRQHEKIEDVPRIVRAALQPKDQTPCAE